MSKKFYRCDGKNLILELQIQTKAIRDAIIGEHNNRLKISITAVKEAGKANKHLTKFLAEKFGVLQKQVQITKGHTSRYKSVLLIDANINSLLHFTQ